MPPFFAEGGFAGSILCSLEQLRGKAAGVCNQYYKRVFAGGPASGNRWLTQVEASAGTQTRTIHLQTPPLSSQLTALGEAAGDHLIRHLLDYGMFPAEEAAMSL